MLEQKLKRVYAFEFSDKSVYVGLSCDIRSRILSHISRSSKRVGPTKSLSDGLLHEVAHVAEIQDNSRLLQSNFGLHIKKVVHVFGQTFFEPITWNATKLEARVILWQSEICKHFGIPFDPFEFATSLKYMADHYMVPIKGIRRHEEIGYVNESGENIKYEIKLFDELRHQTIVDYMNQEFSTGKYTYENFLSIWEEAKKFLENQKIVVSSHS